MDLDKLQVAELRQELGKRGEDIRGTKSVLRERLQQVLKEEALAQGTLDATGSSIQPVAAQEEKENKEDVKSVRSSHSVTTRTSSRVSVASERALEAARRAGLHAKAAALKKKHELEEMQEQLRRKKEELEIQAELDESLAKEDVLAQFEKEDKRSALLMPPDIEQGKRTKEERPRAHEEPRTHEQEPRTHEQEPRTHEQESRTHEQEPRTHEQEPRTYEQEPRTKEEQRTHKREPRTYEPIRSEQCPRRRLDPTREQEPRMEHTVRTYQEARNEQEKRSSSEDKKTLPARIDRSEMELAAVIPNLKRVGMQPLELHVFDGKEEEFLQCLAAFEANIAAKLDNEEEKLLYLLQKTRKKPHDVVATCVYLGERGYQEALRLLKARYSNSTTTRASLIEKMMNHSPIRYEDVEGFDSFAILLRGVLNALHSPSVGHSGLEPGTIRRIIEKVPWMADRWRRNADRIQEEKHRQADFKDLVDFMETEARISRNPAYGKHLLGTRGRSEKMHQETHRTQEVKRNQEHRRGQEVRGRTLAGSVKPVDKCLFCEQPHETAVCQQFANKTNEEKSQYVMSNGLCFGCLKKGHRSKDCEERKECMVCKKKHPTSLHRESMSQESTNSKSVPVIKNGHISQKELEDGGKLQKLQVTAKFMDRRRDTGAFLDSGSTHSFITRQLVNQLGITPQKKSTIIMSTINGDKHLTSSIVAGVWIRSREGNHQMELPPLYVLDEIPVDREDFVTQDDVSKWYHLRERGVSIHQDTDAEGIGLLIGGNAAAVTEPLEVVGSEDRNAPYAVRTRFGWSVCGVGKLNPSIMRVNRMKISRMMENQEDEDNFGSCAESRKGLSMEDVKWCLKVEQTCTQKDGKYEIGLPFREESPKLQNNYKMAERRLELLKKKFNKDPCFAAEYKAQVEKMLKEGYAEEVKEEEQKEDTRDRTWYLPHHGVRHPAKPEKLRVVFDCAARYHDTGLNDTLLQGPDLTNSLFDVLTRFRQEPVAFTADVEAMFLQVMVPDEQRNYLRFLWWPGGDETKPIQELRMTRHLFGATSSPSCANYALRRTGEDHRDGFGEEVVETLKRNFYVDDVVKATASEDEAAELALDLKQLCAKGGFRLTKFSSNSVAVLRRIPKEDRDKEVKELELGQDPLPEQRALGVLWDKETDQLGFRLDVESLKKRTMTRRGILSATAACYDPLGLAAPYLIRGRMILQELTRLRLGWDDQIPSGVSKEWNMWLMGLDHLAEYRVPRCVCPGGLGAAERVELHHFADASQKAYGTASYVRVVSAGGGIYCALLMSRARVAPIKSITIPRLELSAAKLAVEVNQEVTRSLDVEVDDVIFWSDSTTVLKYVNNETTRYHVFVANRLAAIHDGSKKQQWRYVPSNDNPADQVTRGGRCDTATWSRGPEFLWKTPEHWPQHPDVGEVPVGDPEVKAQKVRSSAVRTAKETSERELAPVQKLIKHYSTWTRLRRAVAWIRRVLQFLKKKTHTGEEMRTESEEKAELTMEDLKDAERCIVQHVQRTSFRQELEDLEAGRHVRLSSRIVKLSPYLEEGCLRVGGRLENSALSWAAKHPLILPGSGEVVDLIIADAHRRVGHEGRQHVMSELRNQYWVLKANSAVRRTLSSCLSCRRRLKPVESQKMANLPPDRVEEGEPPFTSTGVDYFGPFYTTRGRKKVKKYGVIFTCLSVRAVHIEIAESMSTDSFICALRRFISRRGNVRLMRSDRGTNFVGAEREMKEEINHLLASDNHIKKEMLEKAVDWRFNAPTASHHGGAWERMIRTVRKIFNAILNEQTFSEETLHTLMCEVECIVNNRPLVPVSMDPGDDVPLTPNHILHLKCILPSPDTASDADLQGPKRWRQAAYLAEQFWRRWRREYVPLLQQRDRRMTRSQTNLKPGDIVLVVDDLVPRGVWPLGRVEEAMVGDGGKVRSVRVRTRGTVFLRPVTKVVKIV